MKYSLIVSFLLVVNFVSGQTRPLFKITQNDKVGYISNRGKTVIKPVFLSGGDFSEGLAAVRLNGHYGFINRTGKFVIAPRYDYAGSFSHGIAVAYNDGIPSFIDKKGETVLPSGYKQLSFLNDRKAIVTTITDKRGIIDIQSKQLIVDTLFSSIQIFDCGVAIVKDLSTLNQYGMPQVGVIDTTGKFVVPFGKYNEINTFYDGFATVYTNNYEPKKPDKDGVIDAKGNLLFERLRKNNSFFISHFCDGYAPIALLLQK